MKKRIISVILLITMVLALIPPLTSTTRAFDTEKLTENNDINYPAADAVKLEAAPTVPASFEEAMAMVDFSSSVIGVTRGRIRYMAQMKNDSCFLDSYWVCSINDKNYIVGSSDGCTRSALSMALSYFGLDYTPGYMSTLYGSTNVPSPLVDIPNRIDEITRIETNVFDTLWNNYVSDCSYSPVVLYFSYKHSNGIVGPHAILVVGKNGDTYYAVDSAANNTHLIDFTFNADKTAIASCSYGIYTDTCSINNSRQWQLTGEAVQQPCTINFYANGGNFSDGAAVKTMTVDYGRTLTLDVESPALKGSRFLNWSEAGIPYKTGDSLTVIRPMNLYAVWEDTEVDILYDYNDDPSGENVTRVYDTLDISAGAAVYTIQSPQKDSYNGNSFKGWIYQDPNGAYWWANSYGDNGRYSLLQPGNTLQLDGDLALYAKWTWLVHYDLGNGQFTHAEVGDGTEYVVQAPASTPDGKTFVQWTYTGANGQSGAYQPGDTVSLTSDLYLTAVWAEASDILTGTVMDATVNGSNYGNPIQGVVVEFFDASDVSVGAVVTDEEGVYTCPCTKDGTYKCTFTKAGYGIITVDTIVINANTPSLGIVSLVQDSASTVTDSGQCGDLAAWIFQKNGTLSVVGAGEIYDYSYGTGGPWSSYKNSIYNVVVNDSITRIGNAAFYNIWGFYNTSVYLSKNLVSIGSYAFSYFHNLGTLVLPESLEVIGSYAFWNSGLTSITVPKNVREIGYHGESFVNNLSNPFIGCSSLSAINVDADNPYFCSLDGVLYTKDLTTLVAYPEGKEDDTLVIPDSVENVVEYAFGSMNYTGYLKYVNIPEKLSDLFAFRMGVPFERFTVAADNPYYCSVDGVIFSKDMKTLELYPCANSAVTYRVPDSVETLGGGSFAHCSNLITLELPDGLTTIEVGAIQSCDILCNLVIPAQVTRIEYHALYQCNSLTNIYFMGDAPATFGYEAIYHYSDVGLILYYVEGKEGWTSPTWTAGSCTYQTAVFDPDNLDLRVAKSGACGDNIVWEIDRNGVLSLTGTGAMPDYQYATIPWRAFQKAIQEIKISNGITSIGQDAFYGCSAVTKIVLPNSVTAIGNYAFSSCEGLISLKLSNQLETIGSSAFSNCSNLTAITLPDSLLSIGDYGFSSCRSLTNIVIPDSMTAINNNTFNSCEGLLTVELPQQLQSIGKRAFGRCTSLTGIVIPDSVETIGDEAFYCCRNLTNVHLPDGLLSIQKGLFQYCDSLTDITIPDSVVSIGESAFDCCRGLTQLHLPDSLQTIGSRAFYCCESLPEVTIPGSVQVIGSDAFHGCAGLTEVTIPEGVLAIGSYAFEYCDNLTTVILPASLQALGSYVFYPGKCLTSIYFYGDVPSWSSDGLWSAGSHITIYYISGKTGWTSPTWTSPSGTVFQSATWKPKGQYAVTSVETLDSKHLACTIDEAETEFTQMIVGAYDAETGKFLGAAIGQYDGSSNVITVTFQFELPENYILRVFCTDDSFMPQYEVSQFSPDNG